MGKFKCLLVIVALVMSARYFPVFYYATQFNDSVKQAPQKARMARQLQQEILQKAALYFVPVQPSDIQIKESDELIRVKVSYKVPVDFFVFKHELSFHASGAGLAAR